MAIIFTEQAATDGWEEGTNCNHETNSVTPRNKQENRSAGFKFVLQAESTELFPVSGTKEQMPITTV